MQSIKEKIHQILDKLPPDADYEDVMEAIYVQKQIDEGMEQLKNGEYISHDEIKARMAKWLK